MSTSNLSLNIRFCVETEIQGKPCKRVPKRFFEIWLISRPGFGILKEKVDEIQDCNHGQDTGFGDFNKRESGNVALKKPRFGNSRE